MKTKLGLDFIFFQAEDGIRDLVRSRGLGDVYKRQVLARAFDDLGELDLLAIEFLDQRRDFIAHRAQRLSLIHI